MTISEPRSSSPPGQAAMRCNSCSIIFRSNELYKHHWKSDWHRYNLQRHEAKLPPLTAEEFASKIVQSQNAERELLEKKNFSKTCQVCEKTFNSLNAYNNHLNSKRHAQLNRKLARLFHKSQHERALSESSLAPSEISYDDPMHENTVETELAAHTLHQSKKREDIAAPTKDSKPLTVNNCIFCPHLSLNPEQNLLHMHETHNFFLPEPDFLEDKEGLLDYLVKKVSIGHTCIMCNRQYHSLIGVRHHMREKSHYSVAYNTDDEIIELADFYNFSGLDLEELDDQSWESMSDSSANDELSRISLDESGIELTLPSGSKIGHRSMARYFKQNLRIKLSTTKYEDYEIREDNEEMIEEEKEEERISRFERRNRDRNAPYNKNLAAVKDLNSGRKAFVTGTGRYAFRETHRREQFINKVSMRHNNQKHFRDQLLQ